MLCMPESHYRPNDDEQWNKILDLNKILAILNEAVDKPKSIVCASGKTYDVNVIMMHYCQEIQLKYCEGETSKTRLSTIKKESAIIDLMNTFIMHSLKPSSENTKTTSAKGIFGCPVASLSSCLL
jgi:hypothetical protein